MIAPMIKLQKKRMKNSKIVLRRIFRLFFIDVYFRAERALLRLSDLHMLNGSKQYDGHCVVDYALAEQDRV